MEKPDYDRNDIKVRDVTITLAEYRELVTEAARIAAERALRWKLEDENRALHQRLAELEGGGGNAV